MIPLMLRQAHHEWNQQFTVVLSLSKDLISVFLNKAVADLVGDLEATISSELKCNTDQLGYHPQQE